MIGDPEILEKISKTAIEHYRKVVHGPTGKLKNPSELLSILDLSLKENPITEADLFDDIQNFLNLTTNTLTPNFFNQLFSGINIYSLAGDWISSLTNTTMATFEVSPMATLIEATLIEHMIRIVGWNDGDGIMATGGSNANMIALLLARNTLFPEIKKSGHLSQKISLFVSEDAHYSFDKAANILGLGLEQVRKIKTDENGEMDPVHLDEMIQKSFSVGELPFFVAATAGTTVLGAFDPIQKIHEVTKKYKLWLHVDGAWGGSVLISSKHRPLLSGIELADSMTWDTHKMMGTGLMSSFFLTKHRNSLRLSHDDGGNDYIFHESDAASWDSGPSSLQCGRRNDAFKVWLAWRALGDSGFERQINCLFDLSLKARVMIENLDDLELMYIPRSLNICFRFKRDTEASAINKEIRKRLLEEGNYFINIATRKGETFFRLIIANRNLKDSQLESLFSSIIRLGKMISTEIEVRK